MKKLRKTLFAITAPSLTISLAGPVMSMELCSFYPGMVRA